MSLEGVSVVNFATRINALTYPMATSTTAAAARLSSLRARRPARNASLMSGVSAASGRWLLHDSGAAIVGLAVGRSCRHRLGDLAGDELIAYVRHVAREE